MTGVCKVFPAIFLIAFVPLLAGEDGSIPTTTTPPVFSVDKKQAEENIEELNIEQNPGYKTTNLEEETTGTEGGTMDTEQNGSQAQSSMPSPGAGHLPAPPSIEELNKKIRSRPRQIKKRKGELTP